MMFLGIDGGQTSTKVCFYDLGTREIVIEKGLPIDHMLTTDGQEIARKGIQESIHTLLNKLNRVVHIDVAVISISGLRVEHTELIKSWVSACMEVRSFIIVGDVIANISGASAGENDGILVIAGGGSIAYYSKNAIDYTAGGFGHILGDEGSAYRIGLDALQASIRFWENRGAFTVLYQQLLDHFERSNYWDIKTMLHGDQIKRNDIANLAVIVNEAATQGDTVSQHILRKAGVDLGELAISVIESLERANISSVNKIYPTGGVFSSEAWIIPAFEQTIHKRFPAYRITKPIFSPLIGTLIIAADSVGMKRKLLTNLEE